MVVTSTVDVAVTGAVAADSRSFHVVVTAAEMAVPHRHELEEEENEDGHQRDAFDPWVFRNRSGQTFVAQGLVSRSEELGYVSLL